MIGDVIEIAKQIHADRYRQAEVVFLAGSVVRGEETTSSDLDLVVVFSTLPNAYRESFKWSGWPVEAFVHDPETIRYFFRDVDRASGVPSLPAMVSEGIEVPEPNALSRSLKALAAAVLAQGPPRWGRREIDNSRYAITDVLDDLYDPRSRAEQIASATVLFGLGGAAHFSRSRLIRADLFFETIEPGGFRRKRPRRPEPYRQKCDKRLSRRRRQKVVPNKSLRAVAARSTCASAG